MTTVPKNVVCVWFALRSDRHGPKTDNRRMQIKPFGGLMRSRVVRNMKKSICFTVRHIPELSAGSPVYVRELRRLPVENDGATSTSYRSPPLFE